MKIPLLILLTVTALQAAEPKVKDDLIILDETRVQNLGLVLAEVEETEFEQTIFALGHIEVLPGKRAVVSSRIAGRAFSVLALPHQEVEEGDELLWVESRQPGDPPPTVMLPAPMAGWISKVDVSIGQPITPDQSLIEIIDLETVEASAKVPQHLASKLQLGQSARIRVTAFPDQVFEAKLAHLGIYADEASGTLEAAFHVSNADKLLRPGMRAEFTIVTNQREAVMSIPREAIQGDASGRYVYVADYELKHAFVKAAVKLGEMNDERVEILSGLLPGDEVVVKGAYLLSFAGKGNVSLKEALDAVHGHPHNEDGTEMTPEQEAAAHAEHAHEAEGRGFNALTLFFAATTALLLVLLILSTLRRKEVGASC